MPGFVTGLGAATADALYGLLAASGLTLISGFLVDQQIWLRLVGGLFLCYLGVKTLRSTPPETSKTSAPISTTRIHNSGLLGTYGSTVFLTLTNPMTILSFAGFFAGSGFGNVAVEWFPAARLVAGVFLGSAGWWFLLSGAAGWLRLRVTHSALVWVNRAAGGLILVFGAAALINGLWSFLQI
jgi:threonine/homoserine/homoserine lactone efflux protein